MRHPSPGLRVVGAAASLALVARRAADRPGAQAASIEDLVGAVVRIKTFINPDGRSVVQPRPRARRQRHPDRRERPGADHRLSDGRGARRRGRHQRRPHRAGQRGRLRPRDRLRPAAHHRAAQAEGAADRQGRRPQGGRSGAGRELRRRRHGGAGARREPPRVRRQLGVHDRPGDLHLAAASGVERRGADQPRRQAGRRRLADRRRRRPATRTTPPATCSCRSTS